MDSVQFGDVELFIFSEKHMAKINKYRKYNNLNGFYDNYILKFIQKNFINKVCIKTTESGDQIKASEKAIKKMKQVISIFRFIVCILAYERIYKNLIKINLLAESYNVSEKNMYINLDNKIISLNFGPSRKSLHKLPFDAELIKNLKENCFFNDLISICFNYKKTELEEAILTAIYWVGEAQNDFDRGSAFIKYWIALETLFSISEEKVTESLAKGVAILLAFGGYKFIEITDVKKIFSATKKLYLKRNKIVHRGIYEDISPMELSEVCKYAVWCVLSCLGLRAKGYETLEQIRRGTTNRLYKLSTRGHNS